MLKVEVEILGYFIVHPLFIYLCLFRKLMEAFVQLFLYSIKRDFFQSFD